MRDEALDEESRLRRVLQSLAKGPENTGTGERLISASGGAEALRAILREIDETVLPRRLTFSGGPNVRCVCDVAERRIIGIDAEGTASASALSTEDAADLAARIASFCKAAATVHVRRDLIGQGDPAGATGISLSDLSPHLTKELALPVDPVPVEMALAESESYALALFETGGDGKCRTKGQGELVEKLRVFDGDPAVSRDFSVSGTPVRRIWIDPKSDKYAILLVALPQRRIWLAFEPDHLDACIACWARVG